MCFTVHIIFINFDNHSPDWVARPVWPPKGLRDRLVARGRKRLCTTAVGDRRSLKLHVIAEQQLIYKCYVMSDGLSRDGVRSTGSRNRKFNPGGRQSRVFSRR